MCLQLASSGSTLRSARRCVRRYSSFHTNVNAAEAAIQVFTQTLMLLKQRFKHVFFVPGNHDLWCRKDHHVGRQLCFPFPPLPRVPGSCLGLLIWSCWLAVCSAHTGGFVGEVTNAEQHMQVFWCGDSSQENRECSDLAPSLLSFDRERDIQSHSIPPPEKKCTDYKACKWPAIVDSSAEDLACYFDELNVLHDEVIEGIRASGCPVITFSHFPRVRKTHGSAGSPSSCPVFGHTHFCWDATLDGVRYIQAPLAYPRERERGMNGGEKWLPLCVYESETGMIGGRPLPCHWTITGPTSESLTTLSSRRG